jgi:PAS domain S-box-containing protein
MSANADSGNVTLGASAPTDALRLVLETALDAVVVMRDDGTVADWNDQAVTVFGWTHEEAVGRGMADLIIPERYREAHKYGLKRYLSGGEATVLGRRIEVSGIRKNGEEFPIELSITPIRGDSLLFVGFLRDMTERSALRQAQSEVARMTQRMAMGQMAASIVHEINQPLAAVAANADAGQRWLSRERPNIEEARAAFKRIVGDSRRASAIIDEIRLMFRHDGVTMTALDVNDLIRDVLSLLRGDLENHRISVDAALPDGLPPVSANVVQLRQVMVNLITNAADAMSTVMNRQRLLRLRTQAHEPDGLFDHRGGQRKRYRSTACRPHFRAVFYDQIPRHGHGAVDLPLHRRTSRRPPFGRAGPHARIDLSGLTAGRTASRGRSGARDSIARSNRRPVAVAHAG